MENLDNTYQNPEPENITGQEENSSPVELTENQTDPTLPTEEEFTHTLPELKEEHLVDHEDDITEDSAVHLIQEQESRF